MYVYTIICILASENRYSPIDLGKKSMIIVCILISCVRIIIMANMAITCNQKKKPFIAIVWILVCHKKKKKNHDNIIRVTCN